MTAVVVLDAAAPDDLVTISAAAAKVGESEVGLVAGEKLSVRQLLEATLVHSGNDAALALAEHVAGSEDAFVALMNEKAAELGLTHTSFANPHGLDEPGHHTSARDLAALSVYAMKDSTFAEIVGDAEIALTVGGARREYESSNKLLGTYEGTTGIKTGWTNDAGYCVVVSATRGGIDLVAVVMGTKSENDRFAQARTLLDWGFEHYAVRQLSSADETAAVVAVADYLDVTIPAVVGETTSTPVFDLAGDLESRIEVAPEVEAPVSAGDRLGTLTVSQAGQVLAEVPIVAAHDVRKPDLFRAVGIWFTRMWRTMFGGQLVAEPAVVM
jgi:D-alanyl-D-alanine carboxypeptidase (penicillin-binding protein 5/6)